MAQNYSPRIVQSGLVMCLDASQNKSYPTTDLPVKGGLLLWLDASDDSTFSYSSGTEVSQWRDKSGNNFHANQSTTARQPSRSTNINSRKSLNFTSTNGDYLRVDSGMVFTNSVTAIAVIKPGTQNYAYANILDQDHGMSGGANGWVIQRNNVSSAWQSWVANAAGDAWFNPNQVSYTDNTSQIVTVRKGSSTISLYSNGTSSGDNAISDQQIRQANYYGLNIGSWRAGGFSDRHYNGEICEVVVYNRILSITELQQVHTYLGQKWGILNTDRSIIDLAGNDDNGLLGNGATANMPVYNYYNKGGLRFNSSFSNYVVSPNTTIAGSQTFCVWAVMTGKQNSPTGVLSQHDYASTANFGINIITSNQLAPSIGYTNGTREYQDKTTTATISYNQIFNAVLVYNAGLNRIYWYINGVLDSQYDLSLTPKSTNWPIGLGRWDPSYPNYYFDGTIFSALIYNKALSAEEVAQNYEAQKSRFANTIVQQNLMLHLDAENPYSYSGAGTTWYDISGNNYNATMSVITSANWVTYNGNKVFETNDTNGQNFTVPSFPYPQSGRTYEIWINSKSFSIGWQTWFDDGGGERILFGTSTNSVYVYPDLNFTGANLAAGNWYQLVYTLAGAAGTTCYAYVNGVSLGSGTYNSTIASGSGNLYILGDTVSEITSCYCSVVRVYNRVLSATEVLQNYNATKGRFGL